MATTVEKLLMFRNRLEKVYKHLSKQARKSGITCFRIYDHDLPEFPFSIEFYENRLYVAEYKRRHSMTDDEHDAWLLDCKKVIYEVLKVSEDDIFIKLRQRKPGRLGQYQKTANNREEFEVNENGLRFLINLSDYLDTGLFLDHRITRSLVKELAENKSVLNLFCYTGSFSVYAAAGGATEVTSVDLSNTYLDWARRNMHANNFTLDRKYKYTKADVLQLLPAINTGSYDLIIMDPPTFSNSKMMEDVLDVQEDHVEMLNECLRILTPGGTLIFSTNLRDFQLNAEKINSSSIKDITAATTPFDFKGKLRRYCFQIVAT